MLDKVVILVPEVQHSEEIHPVQFVVPLLLDAGLLIPLRLLALLHDREGSVVQCPLEEVFLRRTLHFNNELLPILRPADHIEHRLPVVFHDSQLLCRNIGDVFNLMLRKDDFQEFNENVLVHFAAEEPFEGPVDHRVDVPRLDLFIHKGKIIYLLNKIWTQDSNSVIGFSCQSRLQ